MATSATVSRLWRRRAKMKTMAEIGDVAAGRTVRFADIEWTILDTDFEEGDPDEKVVFVLAKDVLFEKAFDEDNCNNWGKSTLRKYLNEDWLDAVKAQLDTDPFVSFRRDLTSDDGLKDYGECLDTASLISCDEYRKYRQYIPNKDDWWWTLTARSTPHSGNSNNARCVNTDGSLSGNNAYNGYKGVAPALCVLSDFVVEVVE
jgi:hypothetical protein